MKAVAIILSLVAGIFATAASAQQGSPANYPAAGRAVNCVYIPPGQGYQITPLFEGVVNCDQYGQLRVSPAPQSSPNFVNGSGQSLTTSQAPATTTSSQLCPARANRIALTIENLGTTPVYFGPQGVTTTSGGLLPGAAGSGVTLNTSAAVYGLTSSGTATVACVETF